ncbi:FAD-dependent oxidoreductase [Gordonia sp. zg691]|uniref:FAD-dependent oxidoreductase n=2 Tax=Gordonia jinghuaiqii TaxID=2758710 RepID=A0A7D7QST4_9ACTN|nr:FAD-dependent oxidoreductase [Gordonia jinghuaiqii]MCR5977640.1 FAD-dependent oxidoreductase [Gordonia jinghuaiqii]QMT03726.1 FAD-dependent oxidoreductase [Gordonia jinghuaiqii]
MTWNSSFDVVVVGSGGAALAGALAAVARGLTVCVVEKTDRFGGTSAYSGGSVWLPGNHVLERDGVDDSVEAGLTYFRETVGDRTDPTVQRAFLETGPVVAEFLENEVGIPLEHRPFPDYFAAPGRKDHGRSIFAKPITAGEVGPRIDDIRPMVPADQFGIEMDRRVLDGGQAWIARMLLSLDASGRAELHLESAAESLVSDGSGRVTGVVVRTAEGERRLHARGGVLLAAGGFERNTGLRQDLQQMPSADWTSSHPSTGSGDAIAMLRDVGAKLDLLDQAWWCPATLFPNGHAVFTLGLRAGIVVDETGSRFANELLPYDQMGRALRERMRAGKGDGFWYIFDDRFGDDLPAICAPLPDRDAMTEAGLWHSASSIGDLAAAIGVDAETLVETVDRFNRFAANGIDDDFRRGEDPYGRFFLGAQTAAQCLVALDGSRFHAVRMVLGDLGTKGGAVITGDGAVLRSDGNGVVAGLYAAGNSTASISGEVYPGPGTPLGSGMVMAYRAVADMASQLDGARAVVEPA